MNSNVESNITTSLPRAEPKLKWFVMTHLDIERFRKWFDYVNAERYQNNQHLIQPFYPYEFMKGRIKKTVGTSADEYKTTDVTENAHLVFRRFVFLKATEDDIQKLVYSPNNIGSRVRLRRYLNPSGEQAIVRNDMMEEFFKACVAYRDRFELTPPMKEISVMDKVVVAKGLYQGYEATVERVKLVKGHLLLNLSLPMVADQISVRMKNVNASDVRPKQATDSSALRVDFIRYIQDNLLGILTRRASQLERAEREKKTSAFLTAQQRDELQSFLQDSEMLERMLRYRSYEISTRSANAHFQALMLICAHLCKDTALEEKLINVVQQLLGSPANVDDLVIKSDADAYLCIALKIATNKPVYRDKMKEYIRVRQPKSRQLHEFTALIRKDVKF